jgi:hypothetical protein
VRGTILAGEVFATVATVFVGLGLGALALSRSTRLLPGI